MKTAVLAVVAVLAMAFAGFAVVADDADADATNELTITYKGMFPYEDYVALVGTATSTASSADVTFDKAIAFAEGKVAFSYVAVFDEDVEIDVLNIDDYKAMIKPYLKAGVVTIDFDTVAEFNAGKTIDGTTYDLDDLYGALVTFTTATADKFGEIDGGVDTVIKIVGLDAKKAIEVGVVDDTLIYTEDDLEDAVALAVSAFAGYVSPADAQAMADKAVEDYKAKNPVSNTEQIWMVIAIVALVGLIALGVFTIVKAVKANKKKKAVA